MKKIGIKVLNNSNDEKFILTRGVTPFGFVYGININQWMNQGKEQFLSLIKESGDPKKNQCIYLQLDGHGGDSSNEITAQDHSASLSLIYVAQAITKLYESGYKYIILEYHSCSAGAGEEKSMLYNVTESVSVSEDGYFFSYAANQTVRTNMELGLFITEQHDKRYWPDKSYETKYSDCLDVLNKKDSITLTDEEKYLKSELNLYLERIMDIEMSEIYEGMESLSEEDKNEYNKLMSKDFYYLKKREYEMGKSSDFNYCLKVHKDINGNAMGRILLGNISKIFPGKNLGHLIDTKNYAYMITEIVENLHSTYDSKQKLNDHFIELSNNMQQQNLAALEIQRRYRGNVGRKTIKKGGDHT